MDRQDSTWLALLGVFAVVWPLVVFGPIQDAMPFLTMSEGSAGVVEAQKYLWPRVVFLVAALAIETVILYVGYRVYRR
jgi:TRAP-type mannitol/chloroaromatic compound transport system permease small subunit